MESDNIFSDKMKVGRPELIEEPVVVSVNIITKPRDIVGERIKPYIYYMLVIEINRNSPLE